MKKPIFNPFEGVIKDLDSAINKKTITTNKGQKSSNIVVKSNNIRVYTYDVNGVSKWKIQQAWVDQVTGEIMRWEDVPVVKEEK